jgi:class 3 adenylate cyclase
MYTKKADGLHIAYQVVGRGPLDLLFLSGGSNTELGWEIPPIARVLGRLASFSRLIVFDAAGSGLSDPYGAAEPPSLEERAEELRTVVDAAGSHRVAIVANGIGGLAAIFFAASHPNRTASLVLDGCYARLARAPDYPWGVPVDALLRALDPVEKQPTTMAVARRTRVLSHIAPSVVDGDDFSLQWERYVRTNQGPARARALGEAVVFADLRPVLPSIQAPTLVLYRSGDRFAGKGHAQYLAEHIPHAKLVEVTGEDNLIFVGDSDADLDEIEEFLTGTRHPRVTDRVLATVLFTDIVDSTSHIASIGDHRWRDLLDKHDRAARRQLERFGGREVSTIGDGFVATFDGPGRAVRCACAVRDAVFPLGLEIRAGVHTGEVELRGDDVAGMAVHICARVAALAAPGEVLVSRTVKDLVVGSELDFADRGEHELKGVPGSWSLFSVQA